MQSILEQKDPKSGLSSMRRMSTQRPWQIPRIQLLLCCQVLNPSKHELESDAPPLGDKTWREGLEPNRQNSFPFLQDLDQPWTESPEANGQTPAPTINSS